MCFSPVGKPAEAETGRAWKDPLVRRAGWDDSCAHPAARRGQIPGSELLDDQLTDGALAAGQRESRSLRTAAGPRERGAEEHIPLFLPEGPVSFHRLIIAVCVRARVCVPRGVVSFLFFKRTLLV